MIQQFYPQPLPHNFKFELNKDMNFSAAHYIANTLAGACANIHGHTYFVNVTLGSNELDEMGFITNFQNVKKAVHGKYDHTIMNDHEDFDHTEPSTEVVAETIAYNIQRMLDEEGRGAKCLQVIVRETPTSYVIYRP